MLLEGTPKAIGSSGSARNTAAFSTWIGTIDAATTNVVAASSGLGLTNNGSSSPVVGPDGTTEAGTGGADTAITIALVNNVAERIWNLGGTPDTILCGGVVKGTISSSTVGGAVVAEPRGNNSGKGPITAVNAVDVLVTDFGTFKVVPDRHIPATQVDFIDFDLWSVDYLRPFRTETLAKSGDSVKQLLIAEYGLRAKNGNGSGQLKSAI
jgi:hypothetical protein